MQYTRMMSLCLKPSACMSLLSSLKKTCKFYIATYVYQPQSIFMAITISNSKQHSYTCIASYTKNLLPMAIPCIRTYIGKLMCRYVFLATYMWHEKTELMYTKYTSSYYGTYLLCCVRY